MFRLAACIAGGLVTVLSASHFIADTHDPLTFLRDGVAPAAAAAGAADKADRITARRTDDAKAVVATVEIVGLQNTAIVYRDRNGAVLYSTDPLTNTTVVAKNLKVPSVTVRNAPKAPVREVPADKPEAADEKAKRPIGCDPAFSPLTAPALAHLTARCLS